MDSSLFQKGFKGFTLFLWAVVVICSLHFVVTHVPRYFTPQFELPGGRMKWLFPHIVGGSIVFLLGPIQFSKYIRSKTLKFHRVTGRIYLLALLISGIAGIGLAVTTTSRVPVAAWGLGSLSVVFLITGSMALYAILKRDITQHKEWMIRSYVAAFSTVLIRFGFKAFAYFDSGKDGVSFMVMSWASWAIPLFLTEVVFQFKKIKR